MINFMSNINNCYKVNNSFKYLFIISEDFTSIELSASSKIKILGFANALAKAIFCL